MMTEPRIYIADLAAYNNGILHGVWVDATLALEDIQEHINTLLQASPVDDAEEYAIHDYEGFDGYRLSEYEGIDSAHTVALFIEEHGGLGAELLDYYSDLEEAQNAIDERYHGAYESLEDYARQFTEDTSTIPEHLVFYIDYERMARDWEMSGDIISFELNHGEVHIFSGH